MCDIDPSLKESIVAEHGVDSFDELPEVVKNNLRAGLDPDIEDPFSPFRRGE